MNAEPASKHLDDSIKDIDQVFNDLSCLGVAISNAVVDQQKQFFRRFQHLVFWSLILGFSLLVSMVAFYDAVRGYLIDVGNIPPYYVSAWVFILFGICSIVAYYRILGKKRRSTEIDFNLEIQDASRLVRRY